MVVEEDNAHYTPFATLSALLVQAIKRASEDNEAHGLPPLRIDLLEGTLPATISDI